MLRPIESSSEHLARHRLADLFLDTLPYNAHTTARHALWAGLPVVTHIGNSFAGRVAASLLSAVGLPELITRTRADYEALAIELALDKQKLADIRRRLQGSHLAASLFDAALYAKRLETAFEAMYQRHQDGLAPDHIEVQARGSQPLNGQASQFPKRWPAPSPWESLVDSTIRPAQTQSRASPRMWAVLAGTFDGNETCRKSTADSMPYKAALITSACYLCNTRRKTRSIGRF
ncbi:O-linked N-acetylglucosamine transferase family protein [Bradyrhizobium sp. USDA 3650]